MSPDGTWDPSSSEFKVSDIDLFNSNLLQYSDSKPNWDLYSIQLHPVVEDELLSLINSAFYSRAFISALECNALVRPQGIGGMIVVPVYSTPQESLITLQILSKRWCIGLKKAADILWVTTQMGYQSQQDTYFCRYRTEQRKMRYPGVDFILYTDTLFSKRKSKQGSTCGKMFLTDFNLPHFWGLTSEKLVYISLEELFDRFRVPRNIHSNNDKELTSAPHWRQVCENQTDLHTTHVEPNSPWQNSAKKWVGMLNCGGARLMHNRDAPPVLWEGGLYYES